jgi:hypothetical protein
VISPFQIPLANQENIALDEPRLDLKLSTAAFLSARFPYFTPAGWYRRSSDNSKLRLVDGGYFDNSGVHTALDIGRSLQHLKDLKGYNGKDFEIVYLALADQPLNNSSKPIQSAGLNEVLSPLQAFFNVYLSSSSSDVLSSTFTLNKSFDNPLKNKFRVLYLKKENKKGVKLPLGWFLSDESRKIIDEQTPNPKDKSCDMEKFQQSFFNGQLGQDPNHNICVISSIGKDLQ